MLNKMFKTKIDTRLLATSHDTALSKVVR